nr:FMN-binding protein [uncultured Allomuricauda sp.]
MLQKESKNGIYIGAVCCMALLFFSFSVNKISPRLQEKLNAAVQTTFEVEEFSLDLVSISSSLNSKTAIELGNENFFKVVQNEKLIGYAYLGEAPSMKDVFDYVVLFNTDLSIKKSKVLIYRENHGRQIGSQRWLKQFIGMGVDKVIRYGEDVDAIAGATISAKSMTKAVNDVLKSVGILQSEGIL